MFGSNGFATTPFAQQNPVAEDDTIFPPIDIIFSEVTATTLKISWTDPNETE